MIKIKSQQHIDNNTKNGSTIDQLASKMDQVKISTEQQNQQNQQKTIETNAPDESHYQRFKNQRDHILNCPGMYIGSTIMESRPYYIFDLTNKKYINSLIEVPQGMERLFLEILCNAGDNVERSKLCKVDPGKIDIRMDRNWVIIRNEGVPIPVMKKSDEDIWIPYMIFFVLLSSSNYDKGKIRMLSGMNGLGAKLTSIFSNYFKVDVGDNIRKRRYVQVSRDNMGLIENPIITENYTGPNYVEITYNIDFSKFGYDEYNDEVITLFAGYAADASWVWRVPVTFNDVDLTSMNAETYAKYYFGNDVNIIVHYEWPEEYLVKNKKGEEEWKLVEFTEKKNGLRVPKDHNVMPISELVIADTPDAAEVISFANGIRTMLGGVHVNSASKAFSDVALEKFNSINKDIKLTPSDVKRHFSVLLLCKVMDPIFSSQTKEQLKSPTPKFKFNEKEIKPIENWKLMDRLYAQLEMKEMKEMAKTDGKKSRHVNLAKLQDANWAGTAKSTEAILIVTEGDSAAGYAKILIGLLPGGRDKYGIFPLKGKSLNVMNHSTKDIAGNEEIINVKKAVGLRECTDYMDDINYRSLRYGQIWILADSDLDGRHIIGLVTLIFHCRYPSLIRRGFVSHVRSPTIRVARGIDKRKFLTASSYETWKNSNPNYTKYNHEYFKGLATSEKDNIVEDSKDLRVVNLVYDEKSDDMMDLIFNKKKADSRKKFIAEFKGVEEVEFYQTQSISNYGSNELILFECENLRRNLPWIDGLKIGQRKLIWYAWIHWKFESDPKKKMNVAEFGNNTKSTTKYDYGDKAIADTIINMARQYVGSNNLSYFFPKGQFGNRDKGIDDKGQSRYIYTYPMKWLCYFFRREDIPLLIRCIDEGVEVEPLFFLPILPNVLFNGSIGIGSGFSTFIPNCNPRDIAKWYKCKLQNLELPEVLPWYNKFKGTIKVLLNKDKGNKLKIKIKSPTGIDMIIPTVTQNTEQDIEVKNEEEKENGEEDEKEEQPEIDMRTKLENEEKNEQKARLERSSMMTYGRMNIRSDGVVIVDELPIGRLNNYYRNFLKLLVEVKEILSFEDKCNDATEHVEFHIYGMKNPSYENLKLIKSYGLTNMRILDINGYPRKFDKIADILEFFYQFRLPYYEKRRLHILNELKEEKHKLDLRIKFIDAYLTKKLIIDKRYEVEIKVDMDKLGIPFEIYTEAKISQLSNDKIIELQKKIEKLQKEIDYYTQIRDKQMWLNDIVEFENHLTEI